MAELKERIASQLKVLDRTLLEIEKETERFETAAKREGFGLIQLSRCIVVMPE